MSGRRHRTDVAVPTAPASKVPPDGDDATRKAILEVVQVWLDRLQLISVIVSAQHIFQISSKAQGVRTLLDDIFRVD